jgi:hypothetical protein
MEHEAPPKDRVPKLGARSTLQMAANRKFVNINCLRLSILILTFCINVSLILKNWTGSDHMEVQAK